MQFSVMQTLLADRLKAYDETIATDLTKLKYWLNQGYQYICSKNNWDFLTDYEMVQTVADITTGTVSVTAGDTAITFSSAPAVSVANRYIQFSSSNDWYKITAHTAAVTTATISPAYGQTTNLTAGTYKVRKLLYSTTTPFESYLDIKKTVNAGRLESINQMEGDFFLPLYLDAGEPTRYLMGPVDSTGTLQFSLANPPSSAMNLLVRGVKPLTEMSANSDVPLFPARWHDTCIDMGAHYGFTGLDDTRAKAAFDLAEIKIADMSRVHKLDLGRHRVMRSVDSQVDFGPLYVLPSSFGPEVH